MYTLVKRLSVLMIAGVLLAGSNVAMAEWETAWNMGFTTDYRFRGIGQNANNGAFSGGVDFSHSSGWYVGLWAATVEQVELRAQKPDDADFEFDIYGGYGGNFTDAWSYDVGLLYYAYPQGWQLDFLEVYGSLTYDFGPAALTGGVAYSGDFFGETGDAQYYYLEVDVPLPSLSENLSVSAHYGHQDIDDNAVFGTPDYDEWNIGVTYSWKGADFDLRYVDTDIGRGNCFGATDLCDEELVFSITANF